MNLRHCILFACLASLFLLANPLRAQIPTPETSSTKSSPAVLEPLQPTVANVRLATVRILEKERPVALGLIVDPSGYIVSKSSQVGDNCSCLLTDGTTKAAKILSRSDPYDLVLIKIEGGNFAVPNLIAEESLKIGTILVVPGPSEKPLGMGVIGAPARRIPPQTDFGAFVQPASSSDPRPKIVFVGQRTAAETAGLKVGDIVLQIENKKTGNTNDFRDAILTKRSGQSVRIKVERGKEQLEFKLALFAHQSNAMTVMVDRFDAAYGISARRDDFPRAFQHDVDMRTEQCGGPVVNLKGDVIGINIARRTRAETLALPICDVLTQFKELSHQASKTAPSSKHKPSDPASRKPR